MKSKIFSLSIATLILWGSTTEPMGRFFRHKSPGFSKVMTGLQWTTFTGITVYESLKAVGPTEALNKCDNASSELTSHIHSVIKDPSVVIKLNNFSKCDASAHKDFETGTKFIAIDPKMIGELPDGIFHHEYAHITNDHRLKKAALVEKLLVLFPIFKTGLYGYKIMRYGYAATKKDVSSIGRSLLVVPGMYLYVKAMNLVKMYQSRLHEYEADDAVPSDKANELADWLDKYDSSQSFFEQAFSSHPHKENRIERLRARAAQAKT